MDPRHRDRIAFVRIVSGEFERGMSSKSDPYQKLSNSQMSPSLWQNHVKM